MAIATKSKPAPKHLKKRSAGHHRQTKHYVKSYWPYLPMIAVIASGFVVSTLLHKPMVLGTQTNLTTAQLLTETNLAREHDKLTEFSLSQQLNQAAQAKADDMARKNYWSHTSPDGQRPWNFITSSGYKYGAAGENLAYGFDDANVVTNAWLHSPEHRQNLLSNSFTQVGYGVSQSPNYLGTGPEIIIVTLYARPSIDTIGAATAITPANSAPVSRISANADSATAGFIVGIVGAMALLFVVLRHGIVWRKMLSRGELFVIQHPALDISLIGVATVAVVLSQTAGFIR